MKYFKVFFIALLGLTVCFEAILVVKALFNHQSNQLTQKSTSTSTSSQNNATRSNDSFDTPLLDPQLNLLEVSPNDPTSIKNSLKGSILYINDNPSIIPFTGQEWESTQSNLSEPDVTKISDQFSSYYNSSLEKNNWLQKTQYKNFKLNTNIADGPTGNIWGYIKVFSDKFRLIVLEKQVSYLGKESKDKPFSCPCTVKFRIFVTDILPTSEFETRN